MYGDPEVHPQTEDYWGHVNPVGERSMYDEAKRFGEAITMAYHRGHGVNTHIVRIFNTYGERMRLDDGRVLPNFVGQALAATRSPFTAGPADPQLLLRLGPRGRNPPMLFSDYHLPVNLGNPGEITIQEFADEILRLTGSKSQVVYKPLPPDDPKSASLISRWRGSCSAGSRRSAARRG